jgi:hypothetical protein
LFSSPGPAGPAGSTSVTPGLPGVTGPKGFKGLGSQIAGPTGPPGIPGAPGLASTIVGPTGPSGLIGSSGAASIIPGPPGVAGVNGVPGRPGTNGAQGDPGPDGSSETAVAYGEPGDNSTDPGPMGPRGPPGLPGATGLPGTNDVTVTRIFSSTCLGTGILMSDGSIRFSGINNYCMFGTMPCSTSGGPNHFITVAFPVPRVLDVAMGCNTACALGNDNNVYCSGYNAQRQAGTQNTVQQMGFTPVLGIPNGIIKRIYVTGTTETFAALAFNGNLYTWGERDREQCVGV